MTQQHDLEIRLAEELDDFEADLAYWEAQANIIRLRILLAQETFNRTGKSWHRKALNVARLDLANLGPKPVEPLSIGMLRGRLHRLKEVAA